MSEELVPQEEIFKGVQTPYGFPVLAFPSYSKDSTIFMTPGHQPPDRRLIAAFSWILRDYSIIFLVPREPTSFLEWGFAKAYKVAENDEAENFRVDLFAGSSDDTFPVTYFEC